MHAFPLVQLASQSVRGPHYAVPEALQYLNVFFLMTLPKYQSILRRHAPIRPAGNLLTLAGVDLRPCASVWCVSFYSVGPDSPTIQTNSYKDLFPEGGSVSRIAYT